MSAPLPTDETERLDVLRRYNIVDTPPEPDFDAMVHVRCFPDSPLPITRFW
jgi:hypothetical protein